MAADMFYCQNIVLAFIVAVISQPSVSQICEKNVLSVSGHSCDGKIHTVHQSKVSIEKSFSNNFPSYIYRVDHKVVRLFANKKLF
jgi:hypothetical protein